MPYLGETHKLLSGWFNEEKNKTVESNFANLTPDETLEFMRSFRWIVKTSPDFVSKLPPEQRELAEIALKADHLDAPGWTYSHEIMGKIIEKMKNNLQNNSSPARNIGFVGYKPTYVEQELIEKLKRQTGIESTSELLRVALMEKAGRDLHSVQMTETVEGVPREIETLARKRAEQMMKEYEQQEKFRSKKGKPRTAAAPSNKTK